jgi:TonB family protein
MPILETPPNPAPSSPTPQQPVKFATRRFGELEQHELIHLLDSIDDDISKARFRESIYISVIICLALAWFAIYGPRVLFHQGRIANRSEEAAQKEMKYLDLPPSLVHKAPPKTKIISDQDRRAQTPQPKATPAPLKARPNAPGQQLPPTPQTQPAPRPQQPAPQQQAQQPPAPQPQARPQSNQNATIPDAPRPANASKPNFNLGGSAGQSNAAAANNALRGGGGNYGSGVSRNGPQGDLEILSDTLGVDFGPYIKRLLRILYASWVPLIPEETRPPLNKEGDTLIRFRINPDGSLSYMHLDGSSHDDAINRAAWGSVTGVGQFPPLPKDFTGPNLDLRIHFVISHNAAKNDF